MNLDDKWNIQLKQTEAQVNCAMSFIILACPCGNAVARRRELLFPASGNVYFAKRAQSFLCVLSWRTKPAQNGAFMHIIYNLATCL